MVKNPKLLLISLSITLAIGFFSSFFTISSIQTWYQTLNKPNFTPPDFVFAPVWIILYILMGISLYFVLLKKPKDKHGLNYFFAQLALNFFWSIIFFYLHATLIAFFEILFLFSFIVLTIESFYKIEKRAAYVLIPYVVWVFYAGVLNLSIVLLNKP